MNKVTDFINSGILEMYILGEVSAAESREVEYMAASYPEISDQLQEISEALEAYALAYSIEPHPASRAFVLATISYSERMAAGEKPVFPPTMNEYSTLADFAEYIEGGDMQVGSDFTGIEARIIGFTPSLTTAMVWLKDREISEVHRHEIERFMIIEGSCRICVDEEIREMVPGDYISIPVDKEHSVKITSQIPCKALVQRIAI